jgi:hypothetical protein
MKKDMQSYMIRFALGRHPLKSWVLEDSQYITGVLIFLASPIAPTFVIQF